MDRDRPLPKAPSQYIIRHGLYLDLEKFRIDGRSALGQALSRSKAALAGIFPNGPDAAASLLINQITWKALRLELFMSWDLTTGEAKPTAIDHAVNLSNSLRKDLTALKDMAKNQAPASDDPSLKEYLETISKAAHAQVVKVDR